jgi:hypothetical protein
MAYSADKGDKLLDAATGQTGGMGPPMTYLLDGKQYVAFMGGMGASPAPGSVAPPFAPPRGAGLPLLPVGEPTAAAAAQRGQAPPPANRPQLYVYTLDPPKR